MRDFDAFPSRYTIHYHIIFIYLGCPLNIMESIRFLGGSTIIKVMLSYPMYPLQGHTSSWIDESWHIYSNHSALKISKGQYKLLYVVIYSFPYVFYIIHCLE